MIVYAESSAVLAWLLGEPSGGVVRQVLSEADRVVASALTSLESARALSRAHVTRRVGRAEQLAALRLLDVAEAGWDVHAVSDRVLARARSGFPEESVRTLDAIHLATASLFRDAIGPMTLLSLDERIRSNGRAVGLEVAP